ncbi:hypothetical protein Bcep18194_C7405 [Burkholderia lata]|uniref:Uncharacterized protein n=1 Tax=Burkholderia lata (strain ATCC 17760 / DSM 23089 / LMG 22485 / NCIMB 9086 / R18194 / 383) TaxID=482957 RepID=Q39M67_BURL3|nr:hypothetical protein Bcep18194_C7405 [Burkholderia lata]
MAAGRAGVQWSRAGRWTAKAGVSGRRDVGGVTRVAGDTGQVCCENQFRETDAADYRSCAWNPVVNDIDDVARERQEWLGWFMRSRMQDDRVFSWNTMRSGTAQKEVVRDAPVRMHARATIFQCTMEF